MTAANERAGSAIVRTSLPAGACKTPNNVARTTGNGGRSARAFTWAAPRTSLPIKPPFTLTDSLPFVASVNAFAVPAGIGEGKRAAELSPTDLQEWYSRSLQEQASPVCSSQHGIRHQLHGSSRGYSPWPSWSHRCIPPGLQPDCSSTSLCTGQALHSFSVLKLPKDIHLLSLKSLCHSLRRQRLLQPPGREDESRKNRNLLLSLPEQEIKSLILSETPTVIGKWIFQVIEI